MSIIFYSNNNWKTLWQKNPKIISTSLSLVLVLFLGLSGFLKHLRRHQLRFDFLNCSVILKIYESKAFATVYLFSSYSSPRYHRFLLLCGSLLFVNKSIICMMKKRFYVLNDCRLINVPALRSGFHWFCKAFRKFCHEVLIIWSYLIANRIVHIPSTSLHNSREEKVFFSDVPKYVNRLATSSSIRDLSIILTVACQITASEPWKLTFL